MRSRLSRRAAMLKRCGGWRAWATQGQRPPKRDEKGFTLIELIIVVSIMPIIVGAISAGLISILSLQNSVSSRLADTGDAQVISSTFIKDVQSATFITTSAASSPQCGSTSYTQLLGLQWGNTAADINNNNPANPATLVSYDIVPVPGSPATTYSLVREYCTLGNYTTPATSTVVSTDMASTQPPPCYSGAACDPYDLINNPQIGWTSPGALVPHTPNLVMPVVKFVITEVKSGLVFTLAANSRSWTPATAQGSTVGPPFSPLTLLSQAAGTVLTMSGGSVITITGTGAHGTTAAFASPNSSSAPVPADAALTVSSVFTEDPNLAALSGAGLGVSTPEYYSSSITDPLTSLFNATNAPPATPAWPLSGAPACSQSGLNFTCYSGLYSSNPGFPSGSTVCFCDGFGTYEFASTFVIPWNSNITFDEGQYVFDGSPAIAPGSPPANQILSWTSAIPTTSQAKGATYTPTAASKTSGGASTGLSPAITIDPLSVTANTCSRNSSTGVVTYGPNAGICRIDANQAGNSTGYPAPASTFNSADQIQMVVAVAQSPLLTAQTVTFSTTKPTPALINSTYTPAAASTKTVGGGSTGLTTAITIDATSSSVCTIAAGVVTFKTVGTCLIDANQAGNGTYNPAPQAQQAVVVIPGTGASTITGNNIEFYIKSGSVDFGSSSSVVLTPLSSGLTIWDAGGSASSVTINNIANNRNSYGGIYIPGGSVNATSSSYSGTMSVTFIVANTMSIAGQTTLNVTGP